MAGIGAPKLHHYVPQFYLRRFTSASGRLWLWDRNQDRTFAAQPRSIAAENNFYYLSDLIEQGHDPLTMEKQFSDLEGQVALITDQWLSWLQQIGPGEKIEIPDINREVVSLYMALQFLRTAGIREILATFVEKTENGEPMLAQDKRRLHTDMLWNHELVRTLVDRIQHAIWVFGRNKTATPFITSDNPVAFRTSANSMWVKVGLYAAGTYVVFPLAPEVVMYCYPNEPPWEKIVQFDRCLSPVDFTEEMIKSENSGQVFMASRFIISRCKVFDYERAFAKTLGTDVYARGWAKGNTRSR